MLEKTTRTEDFIRSANYVLTEPDIEKVQRTVTQLEYDIHFLKANPWELGLSDREAIRKIEEQTQEALDVWRAEAREAVMDNRIDDALNITARSCSYEDLMRVISILR